MTEHHNMHSLSHILRSVAVAAVSLYAFTPAVAQDNETSTQSLDVFNDSVTIGFNAFKHMLQRPQVAKKYDHKRFGDHFFVEGNIGANMLLQIDEKLIETDHVGVQSGLAFGDWVTPMHGWRLGGHAGTYFKNGFKAKAVGFNADYLLNITALGRPGSRYEQRAKVELIGVAGIEGTASHNYHTTNMAFGAHLGLRAQYNMFPFSYLFIEPQAMVYTDNLVHGQSTTGFVKGVRAMAGLGYTMAPADQRKRETFEADGHIANHTFFDMAGGVIQLVDMYPENWKHYRTSVMRVALGKWFSPYTALRLSASAATFKRFPQSADNILHYGRTMALTASAGFMTNLHNIFAGYDPDRRAWVNAVADLHLNASEYSQGTKLSVGAGVGLQGHLRVAKGMSLYLEPRVDLMHGEYAEPFTTQNNWDVPVSILAGLHFMQGGHTKQLLAESEEFTGKALTDHLFFEAAGGFGLPIQNEGTNIKVKHFGPRGYLGVGKWFSRTSGTRLFAEASWNKISKNTEFKAMAIGADYLWNLTNALQGYHKDRRFELVGGIGLNLACQTLTNKLFIGANASIQGLWNINKAFSLYLEPQARFYKNSFLPQIEAHPFGLDIVTSLMAGLHVNVGTFDFAAARKLYREEGPKKFISMAGGVFTYGPYTRSLNKFGQIARLSVGSWTGPVGAWRLNLTGSVHHFYHNTARLAFGADYLVDLTNFSLGYNERRLVSLRALGGFDLGADREGNIATKFNAAIHAGAQVACRLGEASELYIEPQVAANTRKYIGCLQRSAFLEPRVFMGLNYNLQYPQTQHKETDAKAEERHFVNASIGGGLHSATFNIVESDRKIHFQGDLAYGYWLNKRSGLQVGFGHTALPCPYNFKQKMLTAYAAYVLDVQNLLTGIGRDETPWMATATLGAGLQKVSGDIDKSTTSPILRASMQIGRRIVPHCYLYVEPVGLITTNKAWPALDHPVDGSVGLNIGAKVSF